MQTEQLLCWSGMTDTEHSKTSSSNEEGLFENFSDCSDWLDKSRPSKKPLLF